MPAALKQQVQSFADFVKEHLIYSPFEASVPVFCVTCCAGFSTSTYKLGERLIFVEMSRSRQMQSSIKKRNSRMNVNLSLSDAFNDASAGITGAVVVVLNPDVWF